MANKILPKRIIEGDILLYKISQKEDNIFKELLILYKANREHLSHWHHGYKELLFKSINDIKNHLNKNKLMCYVIYKQNEIVGCIEVRRATTTDDKLKCRTISYWINKDNMRKGIMYNCLSLLEKTLLDKNTYILLAEVVVENIPSIKLLEKLEFKRFSVCFQISGNGKTMCKFYTYQKYMNN
jgi:RimJ/RimL family protein N-acetyltransferase